MEGNTMSIPHVRRYLELTQAAAEATALLGGKEVYVPLEVNNKSFVSSLHIELVDYHDRDRADELAALHLRQKKIFANKEGKEKELMDLQRAEELHREELVSEREERKMIASELFSLKRSSLEGLEEETVLELAILERNREALVLRENEKMEAIDEVRRAIMSQDQVYHDALTQVEKELTRRQAGQLASTLDNEKEELLKQRLNLAQEHGAQSEGLRKEQQMLENELSMVRKELNRVVDSSGRTVDSLEQLLSEASIKTQEQRLAALKQAYADEMLNSDAGLDGMSSHITLEKLSTGGVVERTGLQPVVAQDVLDSWLDGKQPKGGTEDAKDIAFADVGRDKLLSRVDRNQQICRPSSRNSSKIFDESEADEGSFDSKTRLLNVIADLKQELNDVRGRGATMGWPQPGMSTALNFLDTASFATQSSNPYLAAVEAENVRLMYEMQALSQSMSTLPAGPGTTNGSLAKPEGTENSQENANEKRATWFSADGEIPSAALTAVHNAHIEEMHKLEYEMKELDARQRLDEMKAKIKREQEANEQAAAHEKWLNDQKRELQTLKMKKMLAKERALADLVKASNMNGPGAAMSSGIGVGNVVQRPYSYLEGFAVFWDYATGLPRRKSGRVIGKVRLAFGLYVGSTPTDKTFSTAWVATQDDGSSQGATFAATRLFENFPQNPQARIVVEMQFKDLKSKNPTPESLGWGSFHLFISNKGRLPTLTIKAGMMKVALSPGNVDLRIGAYESITKGSEGMKVFFRLVNGQDNTSASRFIVDRSTAQMYGDLMALSRVKILSGACWRVILFLANVRRKVKERKAPKQKKVVMELEREVKARELPTQPEKNNDIKKPRRKSNNPTNPQQNAELTKLLDELKDLKGKLNEKPNTTEQVAHDERAPEKKRRSSSVKRVPYVPGMGFDVYVDGGMELPVSCSVSKVVVRCLTKKGTPVGDNLEAYCDPMSTVTRPKYNLRHEFRDESYDPTLNLFLRVETVEMSSMEHRVVGYALLNVFCDLLDRQPTSSEDTQGGLFINEGCFELPLRIRPPSDLANINENSMNDVVRVPCATLLVRIRPCATSGDGKSNLSTTVVPEEYWLQLGVVVPPPDHKSGAYDMSRSPMSIVEQGIIDMRASREDEMICDAAKRLVHPNGNQKGLPPDFDVDEKEPFLKWMEQEMKLAPRKMIDYRWTAQYDPKKGFTAEVAGLVNMPAQKKVLYKVIYSLMVPGLFYHEPPDTKEADITKLYDPRSARKSPRFQDPPKLYHVEHDLRQCLVTDVRGIRVHSSSKHPFTVEKVNAKESKAGGCWGLLPVFAPNGHVGTGTYIIPLITGAFPREMLTQEKPLEFMLNGLRTKRYKLTDGAMAIVQLKNSLLPDIIPPPYSDKLSLLHVRAAVSASASKATLFQYNVTDLEGPPISEVVPSQSKPADFFKATNAAFIEAAGFQA